MAIDLTRFYPVFFDEANEHLATMEALLLELDQTEPEIEEFNAIFRAAHSIKGSAATFGFTDLSRVTHLLETILDGMRRGEIVVNLDLINILLESVDILKGMIAAHQEGAESDEERVAEISSRLELCKNNSIDYKKSRLLEENVIGWRIKFHPRALLPATDLRMLQESLAELGTIEELGESLTGDLEWRISGKRSRKELAEIIGLLCNPQAVLLEPELKQNLQDVNEVIQDSEKNLVESSNKDDEVNPGYGFFAGAPGSISEAKDPLEESYGFFAGNPGMEEVEKLAEQSQQEQRQGYGFFREAPGIPKNPELGSPQEPLEHKERETKRTINHESSIRVSVDKVDQLINLVGELVITHAMLSESSSSLDPVLCTRIFTGLSTLERNTRDLQQAVMSIRMMPISFVFNRFPRLVRDTAQKLGKEVNLRLIGEETELDKGLIERLADPLNHLVRNSIDHGLETPEVRRASGKSEAGELILAASQRGGTIIVEVRDDGAGLNREKLMAKAAERGVMISETASDKEVWQLIFAPGFSTAKQVTDISGRGVGMDVVRRNVEGMNGRVEIDSETRRGTRITIRLPLTLAILDGMSVRIGQEIFILPLTVIRESIRPRREQCKTLTGRGRVVQVGTEYLPLVVLHELFNLDASTVQPEEVIFVIVDSNEGRVVLQVEELLAQHQVVIKSLETNYRKVEGISGATILGDGRVAMILDVDSLVRLSHRV